nr:MAG TPA: hypothetical protein [Caudoviricetes sp.]
MIALIIPFVVFALVGICIILLQLVQVVSFIVLIFIYSFNFNSVLANAEAQLRIMWAGVPSGISPLL